MCPCMTWWMILSLLMSCSDYFLSWAHYVMQPSTCSCLPDSHTSIWYLGATFWLSLSLVLYSPFWFSCCWSWITELSTFINYSPPWFSLYAPDMGFSIYIWFQIKPFHELVCRRLLIYGQPFTLCKIPTQLQQRCYWKYMFSGNLLHPTSGYWEK